MGVRNRDGEKSKLKLLHQKLNQARKAFTRARAERAISRATTLAELADKRLAEHPNKHVKAKLAKKLARLQEAA